MIKGLQTYKRLMIAVGITELIWWLLTLLVLFSWVSESSNARFLHPQNLWFWLLIPVVLGSTIAQWVWKNKIYASFESQGGTRMLWVKFEPVKGFLHYFLLRTAIYFSVLAMAQPVMGSQKVKGSKRVLDLVVCLDISNSMNAKDMGGDVSRLTAAKNAIGELLNQLQGERISIVVFANEAYTQLPLTMDYGAAKLYVPDIETSMISDQGTNIGAAFEVAQSQFKDEESSKALLVITDGEDHEKLWEEQVAQLNEKEVLVAYLGLGTTNGALIPNDPEDESLGVKRENGQPVTARLDKAALKKMAQASKGSLLVSSSAFPDITELAKTFTNAKSIKLQKVSFNVAKNYFQIPLIAALLCFLLYLFLPHFVKQSDK